MRLGVVFPQTEIGSDPAVIRDYAQAAESAGYDHLLVFDHVLGGKLERFDKLGRRPPYTDESPFHEVFVLFGYLGACTQRLELVTGIVILPQRQTALVAKQAAAVDVLTGGRLRLGVGIGWNHVEYEALNEDFHTRGRRVSEQIAVMRKLWTEPLVTFKGSFHHLDRAGINPLPIQRPIPVWMGGMAEPVLKRVAQISDGWFPQFQPGDEASHTLGSRPCAYMKESGSPILRRGDRGTLLLWDRRPDRVGEAGPAVARPRRRTSRGEHDGRRSLSARSHRRDPENEAGARRRLADLAEGGGRYARRSLTGRAARGTLKRSPWFRRWLGALRRGARALAPMTRAHYAVSRGKGSVWSFIGSTTQTGGYA
jgi:probable F420-dependent oxidoreductase